MTWGSGRARRAERLIDFKQLLLSCLPWVLAVFLVALMHVPILAPGPFMPQLGLLCVYHWASAKPAVMPPLAAFALGLLQDLWSGGGLGPHALTFAVVAWIIGGQANVYAARPFHFAWGMLLLVLAASQSLLWILCGFAENQALSAPPFALQGVASWLVYPAIAWLCGRLQTAVLQRPVV
jgi:rod shape-determining protein MreD